MLLRHAVRVLPSPGSGGSQLCPAPSPLTGSSACCLPSCWIHHPRHVSVWFLLLTAQEGVLFALPKCFWGLMSRCYVQTIPAVMNHVLPPLCLRFCTRPFFFFQANTFEFRVCSRSSALQVFGAQLSPHEPQTILLVTECKWTLCSLKTILPDMYEEKDFAENFVPSSKICPFLILSVVTQAICTTPCARKELFVHVSLPFLQVLNFE